MADDNKELIEFLTNLDWTKYIEDEDIKANCEAIKTAVEELEKSGEETAPQSSIRVKIVVVGDGAVGKTSLLISYAKGEFPKDYIPTVFENYAANKNNVLLHLWDTAGQEEYDRLRPLSYPGADVVLLCYSAVSQASFDAIREKWSPEVKHYVPDVPHVLCALKIDLRDAKEADATVGGTFEPINKEMGEEMTKQIGASLYREVSAKTRKGLVPLFNDSINLVLKSRNASSDASSSAEGDNKGKSGKGGTSQGKKKNCIVL